METCAVVVVGNMHLSKVSLRQHHTRGLTGGGVGDVVQHNAFECPRFPAHLPACAATQGYIN